MKKTISRANLNRRNFLKLAAAAGVTTAGGHLLFTFAPWVNYDQTASRTWRPFERSSAHAGQMRELVRYATLAANGHNAQPWLFAIQESAIEIHPDLSRQLPVVDPMNRELWISLGCALENLLIATRAIGYTAQVTYPDDANFIRIGLTAGRPEENLLFDAIPLRQNRRTAYNGRLIKRAEFDQILALPVEPGVSLFFARNPIQMETVLEYVNQGNQSQYSNQAYVKELITWLRFNKKEAEASRDGLYTRCSGNPEVPRWLGQTFVASTKPQQQADSDAQKLRSSPSAVVVATEADDRSAWVRAGQVYERLALTMTSFGIQSALLNQPIEAPDLRSQFQNAMGLGASLPQLLVRFGYTDPTLRDAIPPSLRRPIEQVIL